VRHGGHIDLRPCRWLLGTRHHFFLLGASGTGGMEAALVNVLSAGDTFRRNPCRHVT